jgi:hypothetical protein
MLLSAVFFVSVSTLAFEVLLTRVFSIGQWNHLSFMVISIALFGFGASGTFLCIVDNRKKTRRRQITSRNTSIVLVYLYSASAILSFLALNRIPLDYFSLPIEPIQALYLLAAYLLPAMPFFFSGMIISLAYMTSPEKTGLIYFATMAGSALGAVAPIPLLPLLGEGKLILVSALISLIPAIFPALYPARREKAGKGGQKWQRISGVPGMLLIIIMAVFMSDSRAANLIRVNPSPYKALSQILQFPETHVIESTTGIRGRLDMVKTPYLRYAPGLSLKYTAALPGQNAVFRDGDNQLVLYDIQSKPGNFQFAKYLLSYSGYHLRRNPETALLILNGGGSAVPCAAASGARQISIVEPSSRLAAKLRRRYRHKIINQNSRAYLARSGNRYDVIQLENWGTSVPGSAALNQEHYFTIEAFSEYWNHLTPQGVAIISRKLLLPPSDSLRLWAAAYEALKRQGVARPDNHLAILRNFDTFTLLVSKSSVNYQRIVDFAASRNFDLVFLTGMPPGLANRFNVFDRPFHFEEINRLAGLYQTGRQAEYFHEYFLDVAPQSDRRPFPARFLKWSKVKKLYQSMGRRFYALFMSGEIVVSVVFSEALLISFILLIIPILVGTRGTQKPKLGQVVYFFAVGAGFMFVEIYFIKRLIILVGEPVISFMLVIAGVLFFTGLGGIWVYKKGQRGLRLPLALLILVVVLEAAAFEMLVAYVLQTSTGLRYVFAVLFLLPAGFLMGLPFPLGMRYLLNSPVQRAYAWSVNGCASVLTAIVAAQVAISWGIPQVAAAGVSAYGLALAVIRDR